MNYLEVKFKEKQIEAVDASSFISNVIKAQDSLGLNESKGSFNHKKLKELGFIFNKTTKGYGLKKEFKIEELIYLTKEIDKLDNHILINGYLELKIYEGELYIWDKALIYEGIDTFEYCLEHHNFHNLEKLNLLTKSDSINETLLNLVSFTKRYYQPSIEYITQECYWDNKEGYKILKEFVKDANEYLPMEEVKRP